MSPFTGTVNPEQLAIMTEVFDGHCLTHNVVDETDRAQVAILVTMLFEGGATTAHELKVGLERLRFA
jgi:hypothetical protein